MASAFHQIETRKLLAQRGKKLLSSLNEVTAKQKWNAEQIREHQWSVLLEMVKHTFENVPLYRRKYEAAGFHPSQLRSLDDLTRIPMLMKAELRQAAAEDSTSSAHAPFARLLASSGSTGIPSAMYRDEDSLWQFTARNMALYYDWCEGKPLSEVLYFVDMAHDSIDYALADLLRSTVTEDRILSIREPPELLLEKVHEFTPEFISSYPSTMRSIAMLMHGNGETDSHLRLLHLTSEMLDQRTRTLLTAVFPKARVIETYTSTEAGLVAFECVKDSRLHLTEDSAIYEIVDASGNATQESGELIVTDLTNWSTPIIRYRGLGDFCRWETTPCPCGSPLRSIRQLEGRVAQSIARQDGTMLSPYTITNAMDEVAGLYQYQIIQHALGDFEVLVVRDRNSTESRDDIRAAIGQTFRHILQDDSTCRLEFVPEIKPRPGAHKVPLIVSKVDAA